MARLIFNKNLSDFVVACIQTLQLAMNSVHQSSVSHLDLLVSVLSSSLATYVIHEHEDHVGGLGVAARAAESQID